MGRDMEPDTAAVQRRIGDRFAEQVLLLGTDRTHRAQRQTDIYVVIIGGEDAYEHLVLPEPGDGHHLIGGVEELHAAAA